MKTELSVFDKHQFKIARDTLRMSDIGALIMGGMTKPEAREFLARVGWTPERIKAFEES